MSGKRYDTDHLQNELAGGASLFFNAPAKKDVPREDAAGTPQTREPERANARTTERPNNTARRRIITRNSFEIYEDQMEALRDKAYQEKRAGKLGSMSAMVRNAIDEFLTKK